MGIFLFIYFWIWVYKKIKLTKIDADAEALYKGGLFIMAFLTIESVAGSVFLQGSGIIVMIVLGFIIRDISVIKEKEQKRLLNGTE